MGESFTDAFEVADVNEAVFQNGGDLVRKRKVRVNDETKIASRGNGIENDILGNAESRVVDFGKMYRKTN